MAGQDQTRDSVDRIWDETLRTVAARRSLPGATYRLQFHAGFTFNDAARLSDYLSDLGITHCYASPYLRACVGSTHGYDIVDHGTLNPEIGSDADYDSWIDRLHQRGLGQILDTVPNHMGIASNDNAWWNDVLENGPASQFGLYFDIAWASSRRTEMRDKVLLPVLGQSYGDVLECGELRLCFDAGGFTIRYFERRFPVAAHSYDTILGHRLSELVDSLGADSPAVLEYQSILTAARNLPDIAKTDSRQIAERSREKEIIKRRLGTLVAENADVYQFIEQNVKQFNGDNDAADRFGLLDGLLEQQCYRLAYWRVAPDEINYRRFFDVNDLAALSMERQDVFDAAHRLVLRLLDTGKIDGLRIDHPDGLFDPAQYLVRLQESFLLACARQVCQSHDEFQGVNFADVESPLRERIRTEQANKKAFYVVVEKILSANESLADDWPVHGTSGYDFINVVNGLFVDSKNSELFRRHYEELIDDDTRYFEMTYEKKLLVLNVSLSSELHMLTHQLDRLAQKTRKSRDFTFNTLRRALREVIACFPVYRSYIADGQVSEADRRHIELAVRRAMIRNPLLGRRVFRFIRAMLLLEYPPTFNESEQIEQRQFTGKFQQVTGPVTAKGVEDTAFYVYNRLVSLNEVGGDPDRFGISASALHKYAAARQEKWPAALSPLSTHDTKRSEDVRARLNVLSEIPDDWWSAVQRWRELNAPLRRIVDDVTAPDANEEYLLYQTLVGAWPPAAMDAMEYQRFVARVRAYMTKALHEAKVHSSWINPYEDYDNAVDSFVADVLDETKSRAFLQDLASFRCRVEHFGYFNSLAQTLLKITLPGVPDTYQGTELWDFSLVDPDNRRPVDYEQRIQMLEQLRAVPKSPGFARELVESKEDGRIKLFVKSQALKCRRDYHALFTSGSYVPLEVVGKAAEHAFAFQRLDGQSSALVVVPRLLATLGSDMHRSPTGADIWGDTSVQLSDSHARWQQLFTGETIQAQHRDGVASIALAELLHHFPVALCIAS